MCWPKNRSRELRPTDSADNNHRRTTAADSSRQQVVEADRKEDPLKERPPTQGGNTSELGHTSSDKEQQQGCVSAINNNLPARTTTGLSLRQHGLAEYDAPRGNADVCGEYIRRYQRAATSFEAGEGVANLKNFQGRYGAS